MKYLSITFLILSLACLVSAQKSICNLTVVNAPALRGIKLGMTQAQVEKILGGKLQLEVEQIAPFSSSEVKEKKEIKVNVGTKQFYFRIPKANTDENLQNIHFIAGRFYKNYLYDFSFFYTSPIKNWNNIQEFTNNISKTFNLEPEWWWVSTSNTTGSLLVCKGFQMYVDISLTNNTINLLDKNKQEEINKIAEKMASSKINTKETFKP